MIVKAQLQVEANQQTVQQGVLIRGWLCFNESCPSWLTAIFNTFCCKAKRQRNRIFAISLVVDKFLYFFVVLLIIYLLGANPIEYIIIHYNQQITGKS